MIHQPKNNNNHEAITLEIDTRAATERRVWDIASGVVSVFGGGVPSFVLALMGCLIPLGACGSRPTLMRRQSG